MTNTRTNTNTNTNNFYDIFKYQLISSMNKDEHPILKMIFMVIFYQMSDILSSYVINFFIYIFNYVKYYYENIMYKTNTITYKRIISQFMKNGTKNILFDAFDYFFITYIKYSGDPEVLVFSNNNNIKLQLDIGCNKEIYYHYNDNNFKLANTNIYSNCKIKFNKEINKITHYDGDMSEISSLVYTIYITIDKELKNENIDDKYLNYINNIYMKDTIPNINELIVYRNEGINWIKYSTINKRNWDSLFIDEKEKQKIIKSINKFKNKDIYIESGNIWKKIQLCHGLPGTGKTSYIKCVASELNRNIYLLDLSQVNNNTIVKLLSSINHQKSLIAIEDIDAQTDIINKRNENQNENQNENENQNQNQNQNQKEKLTLSQILNIFDGIGTPDGLFVICTTNFKEKFDTAFIRAARIDNDIEFKLCTIEQILNIYKQNYNEDFPNNKTHLLQDNIYYPSLLCNIFFEYDKEISLEIMENEYNKLIHI